MSSVIKIDNFKGQNSSRMRVAAYARVSTDSTDQLASLESQKKYYDSFIKSKKDWDYAGLFYDEGISGTKTEKRDGLLQMLDACRKGKIDFIIVKSISRLARNTVDCLEIVRELYDLGIYVYFEKENINTSKMESELLLTILSSIAEGESRSISKNEKWSIQKRFEQGKFVIGYPPFGYRNDNGNMVVVPEEAEIVKWIFKAYLSGEGSSRIAKELSERGVPSKRGKGWSVSGITGILKNEKYTGDVIYQKSYTDDNYNRHRNNGEKEKYYVKNHHEAIISHEDYDAAQRLMSHHGKQKNIENDSGKYLNRYPFSGKIICGNCGAVWRRRTHYTKSQGVYYAYVCDRHIDNKNACNIKYIREDDIKTAFCNMLNKLIFAREQIVNPVIFKIRTCEKSINTDRIKEIDNLLDKSLSQRTQLMNLFMKQYLDADVYNEENNALLREEEKLCFEKETLLQMSDEGHNQLEELEKLQGFLNREQLQTDFSEKLFEEYIKCITVESRNVLIFELKCGFRLREVL